MEDLSAAPPLAPHATRETPLAGRLVPSEGRGGYRVRAVWRTLQGEGAFAGRPAVFVRLAGCNMWSGEEQDRARDFARIGAACALFCDTDFRRDGAVRLSARTLVAEAVRVAEGVRFAVVTGGEPLLQLDAALVRAFHAAGFFVAIETNGTVALADACTDRRTGECVPPDWIACSPKLPEDRLRLEACDELKLVVPAYAPSEYAGFAARVRPQLLGGVPYRFLWLQPEDGPRLRDAQAQAVALAHADPAWRVSVQTHKVLAVD